MFGSLFSSTNYFSDVLDLLCRQVEKRSSAIIYFTDTEKYGRSTASSQYFLQLAGYLGIPVIAWNADNAGLEKVEFILCNVRVTFMIRGPLSTPA